MEKDDFSILQEIVEEQQLADLASDGSEYVVRGAEVRCSGSYTSCVLNLPNDYGVYTSDARPKIASKDTELTNIKGFNYCTIIKGDCTPKLSHWKDVESNELVTETDYAVSKKSYAICTKGDKKGTIEFETSGQTEPNGYSKSIFTNEILVNEYVELKPITTEASSPPTANASNATPKSPGGDLFGHINIDIPGVYLFVLKVHSGTKDSTVLRGTSAFIYENGFFSGISLKKEVALCYDEATGSVQHIWLIEDDHDYYVEIDWVEKDGVKLSCTLIPYEPRVKRTKRTQVGENGWIYEDFGSVWTLDSHIYDYLVYTRWGLYMSMQSKLHKLGLYPESSIKIAELHLNANAFKDISMNYAFYRDYYERKKTRTNTNNSGIKLIDILNIVPVLLSAAAYFVASSVAGVLSGASLAGSVFALLLGYGGSTSTADKIYDEMLDYFGNNEEEFTSCVIRLYATFELKTYVKDLKNVTEPVVKLKIDISDWDANGSDTYIYPKYLYGNVSALSNDPDQDVNKNFEQYKLSNLIPGSNK